MHPAQLIEQSTDKLEGGIGRVRVIGDLRNGSGEVLRVDERCRRIDANSVQVRRRLAHFDPSWQQINPGMKIGNPYFAGLR